MRGRRTGHGIAVDPGNLKDPTVRRKRIALKYCGGCDPKFDRVDYFCQVKRAAGNSIDWVTLQDSKFEGLLVISGCEIGCPERSIVSSCCSRVVSVKDDTSDPAKVVETLLK